jgi:diguanylate cyclase (GGDEF)-like protein
MQDLLLHQWSVTVQFTASVMLAVFMTSLGRTLAGDDTRWWVRAFQANVLALGVAAGNLHDLFDPSLDALMRGIYTGSKTAFIVCLALGVLAFRQGSAGRFWTGGRVVAIALLAAVLAGTLSSDNGDVRGWHGLLLVLVTAWAAVHCFRYPGNELHWLGFGLVIRSALGVIQVLTHFSSRLSLDLGLESLVGRTQAVRSAFDSGAEWLVLLGVVVAVTRRSEKALRQSHAELQRTNAALVDAVQRDPLTGLGNRRALAPLLEVAGRGGATLLFFDLDHFKAVNDRHGHDVGDACLRRFSAALRDRFADADGVIRYAGDEFVLVDARNAPDLLAKRLESLRAELSRPFAGTPAIEFSVGIHRFPSGVTDMAQALRQADQAMYRNKADRRANPRA